MIRKLYRCYMLFFRGYAKIFNVKIDFAAKQHSFFEKVKIFKKTGRIKIGSNNFNFDVNSDVSMCLILDGEFEKLEIENCLKLIKTNSTVIDIGANIGLHSVYFGNKVKDGLVFAFEPAKPTFKKLLDNIVNYNNIIPLNIAVSNKIGLNQFYVAADDAYSSLMDTQRKEIVEVNTVLVYDLDTLFRNVNLPNLDLIKIDVEGLEYSAVLGMENLIIKYKPYLFVEIYKGNNKDYNPLDTINFLINKGYQAKVFINGELKDFTAHNDNYHNYFFVPLKNV